jgi:hypothetical protein
MIIEPQIKNHNETTYYEIVNTGSPYWACGYNESKVILLISPENDPINAKALASKLEGFGASTYQEMLDEIDRRELIIPSQIQSFLNANLLSE